jgi:hypothetical protein
LSYFSEEDPYIKRYISITSDLANILNEVRIFTKPSIFYHAPNTAIARVEIPNTATEKNIYEAVIHYARFDRTYSVPEGLINICGEKPAGYNPSWSMDEKIEYLKKSN